MRITADAIKASVAAYWRYERQCPIVAFESGYNLADVLVLNHENCLIEIEVKVSLADLRRDKEKPKHRSFRNGMSDQVSFFYFAVPVEIANTIAQLCDNLYPYAGVLGTTGTQGSGVQIYRSAKRLSTRTLREDEIRQITRDQSATLCRLAKKVVELKMDRQLTEERLNSEKRHEQIEKG